MISSRESFGTGAASLSHAGVDLVIPVAESAAASTWVGTESAALGMESAAELTGCGNSRAPHEERAKQRRTIHMPARSLAQTILESIVFS
jgi:hypothetical protein